MAEQTTAQVVHQYGTVLDGSLLKQHLKELLRKAVFVHDYTTWCMT